MSLLRRTKTTTPAATLTRAPGSPTTSPATTGAAHADYVTGKDARAALTADAKKRHGDTP